MSKPIIILVAPQMGENIGACARAMKNFGISKLRIVSPRDGWPNEKAISTAVSAVDIIHEAKIYNTLTDTIIDLEYLYATSSTTRNINKNVCTSKTLLISYPTNAKVGIMFGRENCGLTNEEITYANKIITIETNEECISLNIAQSVCIICYELMLQMRCVIENTAKQKLADKGQMQYFSQQLLLQLDKKGFFKMKEKKHHMTQKIVNLFHRIDKLSESELHILYGIVNTLNK